MIKFDAIHILGILMLSWIAFAPVVEAGCSCSGGTWDPSAFLNSELGTGQPVHSDSSHVSAAGDSGNGTQEPQPPNRADLFPNGEILKSMKSVSSSDVVVDVSNGDSYSTSHIKDAIHIPSNDFLNGKGDLKTDEELAAILGDAGISRNDSIVLYGSKESSGEAEFAFLVLRYLGQENVKLLDGSFAEWKAAGLPEEASANILPGREYEPLLNAEIMADYEYVNSSQAQIVDVRPFVEYGKGRIPGSIALDPSNLIKGDKIRDSEALSLVFSRLDKEKPIVVYSDDYNMSSLAAYALQLMGYEASIYTWEDWKAHESTDAQAGTTPASEDAIDSKYTKLGTT